MSTTAGLRTIATDARGNTASESRAGGQGGGVSVTTAYDGYARLTAYIIRFISSYGARCNNLLRFISSVLVKAGL